MWCGITEKNWTASSSRSPAFSGVVRGQSQNHIFPVGSCLSLSSESYDLVSVPCSEPHANEVTGTAQISSQIAMPTSTAGWAAALQSQCGTFAQQYVGHPLAADENWGWIGFPPQDWTAGDRSSTCYVYQFDAQNNPVIRTGSLQG
jgi:hypothetical protein